VVVIVLGISWHLANVALHPQVKPVERTYKIEADAGKLEPERFEALPREEVRIASPYGYELYGLYFPVEESHRTVIIAHGVTFSLYGSVKYMWMFRERGFNVLMYDHRNHGRSGGETTTYGYYEKHDLKACVDWVLARHGERGIVGVHGESMGAAIALQHAAIDPRVHFVVADCPYASVWEQFAYRIKVEYHLPAFPILPIASWFSQLRAGFNFKDAAPIDTISKVDTPIFFIHGKEDDYIPPQASIDMYMRKPGAKKLYLAPNARHAEAFWNNQFEYDRLLGEFLEEVGVIYQRLDKPAQTLSIRNV